MKIPTCEEMGKEIAEKALDEYLINGKSIREWISILADGEYIKKEDALKGILVEFTKREEKLNLMCACADVKQTCADIIDGLQTFSIPDIEKIKEEIKESKKPENVPFDIEYWHYVKALDKAISIIDEHIKRGGE